MKRILLLHFLTLALATAVAAQEPATNKTDAANWKRFAMKGEEFSVILPTLPAMTTNKNAQPGPKKGRVERQFKTSLQGVIYSVDVFENAEPKQSLGDFVAEQNTNNSYDLTTEREVTVDGYRGKQYSSQDKTSPATVQFLTTERRLYKFSAVGPENAAMKQFFSAIALKKRDDAIRVDDGPGLPLETVTIDKVYKGADVDTKAQLQTRPDPTATQEALSTGISGSVILRVVFSSTGEVTNIKVVKGLPNGLTELCIEYAKKIKFIPATKDGHNVSMLMQLEYDFNF